MSNEEIVTLIQAGDTTLYEQLWAQVRDFTYQRAKWWARTYEGKGGATVDDLTQAAFMELYGAVASFDPDKNIGVPFLLWYRYRMEDGFRKTLGLRTSKVRNEPLDTSNSLNAPIVNREGDTTELGEFIADPNAAMSIEAVEHAEDMRRLRAVLHKAMQLLSPKEQEVLKLRAYGRTFQEISDKLNLTRQRTHQIENEAIRKIHRSHYAQQLKDYL